MINIDVLTLGNEFKNNDGELFKVTSNFSEGDKIFVELFKVADKDDEILTEDI